MPAVSRRSTEILMRTGPIGVGGGGGCRRQTKTANRHLIDIKLGTSPYMLVFDHDDKRLL